MLKHYDRAVQEYSLSTAHPQFNLISGEYQARLGI